MFILFALSVFLVQSKVYISETFDNTKLGERWVAIRSSEYSGGWVIEPRADDILQDGNLGLVPTTDRAFHACTMKTFHQTRNDDLIIQYEVKGQTHPYRCGGAYLKVFNRPFRPESFTKNTSYSILFGPDRCGDIGKILFIMRLYNPWTQQFVEHRLANPPPYDDG